MKSIQIPPPQLSGCFNDPRKVLVCVWIHKRPTRPLLALDWTQTAVDPTILLQPAPCTNSVAIHTSSPDILLYRLQDAATQKETSLWLTISIFNSNLFDFQYEKGRGFAIGSVLISHLQSKYYLSIMFKKPTSIVFAFF